MIPGGVPKGHKALARLIGAPRANREELEAMYDGPIPPEALAGGARAKHLQDALCQFWALTDMARKCIRGIRRARASRTQAEAQSWLTGSLGLGGSDMPEAYQASLDGLTTSLAYYRAERRKQMRWLNAQIGVMRRGMLAAAE